MLQDKRFPYDFEADLAKYRQAKADANLKRKMQTKVCACCEEPIKDKRDALRCGACREFICKTCWEEDMNIDMLCPLCGEC